MYEDTNKNGKWDRQDNLIYYNYIGGFKGCNHWHKGVIQSEAPSVNGFVVKKTRQGSYESYSVFYWEEHFKGGKVDYHVMTPGDESYETNPNAS